MLPTREEAEQLLMEAEKCNPGAWGNHSRIAAKCAERIAAHCPGMDSEKAYILGLLHDIGRKFGVRHLGHVTDGYIYMKALGYDEAARVCLSHSFHKPELRFYIGKTDTTEAETALLLSALTEAKQDEYDDLIRLCDALAGTEGVMNIEDRMADVKRRYGLYPQEKWDANLALKAKFEEATGQNLYELLRDIQI